MTPTEQLRKRLRKLLNEVIPEGGAEGDTNFTKEEIDELLMEADSIYAAASIGWTMKASMIQSDIESYSVGDETYNMASLKDRLRHALNMAEHYKGLSTSEKGGSFIVRVRPPGVL